MSEKLQKVLARSGVGSRREMEEYISAGRVTVDGKVAHLGDRIHANQQVRVDGHPVKIATELPHMFWAVGTPRRVGASSITSS